MVMLSPFAGGRSNPVVAGDRLVVHRDGAYLASAGKSEPNYGEFRSYTSVPDLE
jgi:hypothetical protein